MAAADSPLGFAANAARRGLNATEALKEARAAGLTVRTQTWYRLYGQARQALDDLGPEVGRNVRRRPTQSEIRPWQTVREKGYAQQVRIFMRDRDSGVIIEKDYTLRGPGVISRTSAVDAAIGHYSDFADQYGMQVLGGLYTGTYELQPEQ